MYIPDYTQHIRGMCVSLCWDVGPRVRTERHWQYQW